METTNIGKVSAKVRLDTEKHLKKTNNHPVRLYVYCQRTKPYPTGINLTKEEWEKIKSPNLKDIRLEAAQSRINDIESKARNRMFFRLSTGSRNRKYTGIRLSS